MHDWLMFFAGVGAGGTLAIAGLVTWLWFTA
jgi:hypothetical protein